MELLQCAIPAFVDTLTLLMLCSAITERRFKPVMHWTFVAALIILGTGVFHIFLNMNPWLKPLGSMSWYLAISYLYKGSTLYKIVVTILHYNISMVAETIFLSVLITVIDGGIDAIIDSAAAMMTVLVLSRVILLIMCSLLFQFLRRQKTQIELPKWEWMAVLLVSGFTSFEIFPACIILKDGPSIFLPIRIVLLLSLNIAVVFFVGKLAEWYRIETENFRMQEQMRYNRQSLQNASEAYQVQRRLTHDFDNRLLTIAQLLQQEQSAEALSYVSTILQGMAKADTAVSTNNFIVDAVLNQKYKQAQNQGTVMQFIINDLSGFPLSTDELVTALSNLLDNALEACRLYPAEEKRIIKVKLLLEPMLATISVLNTSRPVCLSGDDIATTKANRGEHGFGLKNIKQIFKKNDFDFAISWEEGWFQYTAIKVLV